MFVTKECDYGIRIIRALAAGTKKTAKTIAEEELIPQKFASKIIKKLEHAKYVQSTLGSRGGYHLNRPLDTLTLADIIIAIDTDRSVCKCIANESDCNYKGSKKQHCGIHKEFMRAQHAVMEVLGSRTMDAVLGGKI